MSDQVYEPLELDLEWESEEETMPSISATLLPPASRIECAGTEESAWWGLEWIEDIDETSGQFTEDESVTAAETPAAMRHRDTLRAAPPPPSSGSGPPFGLPVPRSGRQRRQELTGDAVAVVTLEARLSAG